MTQHRVLCMIKSLLKILFIFISTNALAIDISVLEDIEYRLDIKPEYVVEIRTAINGELSSIGTGVVIGKNYIATSAHVVDEATLVGVLINGSINIAVTEDLVEDIDLAILHVDTEDIKPAVLDTKAYEGVAIAVGWLDGQLHRQMPAYYTMASGKMRYGDTIHPGESGGALIDIETLKVVAIMNSYIVNNDTCRGVGSLGTSAMDVYSIYLGVLHNKIIQKSKSILND